jgi:hypothetical protein
MGRIADSTLDASIGGSEKIPVSPDGHITPDGLKTYARPWKEAAFYISQSSTDAPVLTQVYNDTGATFTPAYSAPGEYTLTASSAVLTANKTIAHIANRREGASSKVIRTSDTLLSLFIYDNGETPAEEQLEAGIAILIIKIYN